MSGSKSSGPEETNLDKALSNIGMNQYLDYEKNLLPSIKFGTNALTSQEAGREQQAKNTTANDYSQQFTDQESKVASGAGMRGNGGGGQIVLGLGKFNTNRGLATGSAVVNSQNNQRAAYGNNLESFIKAGQGTGGSAIQSMGATSGAQNNEALINARAAAAASNAIGGAVGTAAGYGVGNYSLGKPSMTNSPSPAPTPQTYGLNGTSGYTSPWAQQVVTGYGAI